MARRFDVSTLAAAMTYILPVWICTVMPNAFVRISGMRFVAVGHIAAEWYITEAYAAKGRMMDERSTEGCATDNEQRVAMSRYQSRCQN